MKGLVFFYGIVCYLIFFGTFLYTIGFVNTLGVPKGIDDGVETPLTQAIIINVLCLSAFAIQHTIMARAFFKERWTKIIPEPAERSTYVIATSIILIITFWQWRPLPEIIWHVENAALHNALIGASLFGFGIVLYASFLIDHFDLFGLRQTFLFFRGKEYTDPPFATPWLYRLIRNPLMLGFFIAFWATPHMTQGHLLFACVTGGYIFFGITMEERDNKSLLGADYAAYHARTPMLIPFLKFGGRETSSSDSTNDPS